MVFFSIFEFYKKNLVIEDFLKLKKKYGYYYKK